MPKLQPATEHDVAMVFRAVDCLRLARDDLKAAGATKALERVRLAITSAEGALRHVERRRAATVEQEAKTCAAS